MRRPAGLILICVGAFFLALAPLTRFYVAGQVIRAPLNRYQLTRLEATGAAYFDSATLKLKKDVTLQAVNTIRGDVRANEGRDGIAVWDSTTNIYDRAKPGKPVQIQGFRIAFDRRTGELANCCGANVDGDGVRMSGWGLLFPLADVRKRDYPFYDMTTRRSAPMHFNGVEDVHGLTAYRFTQHVPLTRTAALDMKVPGRLLGLGDKGGDRKVDRYAEAYNTVWVDPRTGIPVKHRENIRNTVRTRDGKGSMVVALADLVTIDQDQKHLVSQSDAAAAQIGLVRVVLPVGALLLGLILLGFGAYRGLLRSGPPPPAVPRRADGKFGTPGRPGPPRPRPEPDPISALPTEDRNRSVPPAV